jgi:hypothetical protein
MEDTTNTPAEMAYAAFDNELLSVSLSDENRQYTALRSAYFNADIYAPGFAQVLKSELVTLAHSMGFAL